MNGSKCLSDELSLNERLLNGSYTFFASQLGLFINYILYQLVKFSCGRLRPHFFDVCRPNVECTTGSYVASYVCTGTDSKLIKDAHLSFYSGHASTAFFYATFLTVSLCECIYNSLGSGLYANEITKETFPLSSASICLECCFVWSGCFRWSFEDLRQQAP